MKVVVKAKNMWPIKQRKEVVNAARFAMKYYQIRDEKITLKLTNLGEGYYGRAVLFENGHIIVLLSAGNFTSTILTVFHEFTHVHQYRTKKLSIDNEGVVTWNSKTINFDWESQKAYDNAPWECEARMAEALLYYHYLWRK